ncbi:MAG: phosphate ABC transporter permease PstA [Chloroflexota bacterium]|nr:phosphate ABC transporter permease PstA [Chloroflexota bacterium]
MTLSTRAGRKMRRRRVVGSVFYWLFLGATLVGILALGVLLVDTIIDALPFLRWHFLTSYASRFARQAGLLAPLVGSLWLMGLTAVICFPIGVGAAIYLEEYAPKHWLTSVIQVNIANLAGVPSIVYGLLGLTLFVTWFALGRGLLAGALTMALLVLPVVIITSQEAIRTVPDAFREAAYALGATRWQMVRSAVLPSAMPGILTGTILALSRAVGEAAPIIAISALVFLRFVPTSPLDRFTVLPIQIYTWVSFPQKDFQGLAAAGIVVLLVVLLSMNSVAIYLRNKFQRRSEG